MRTAIKTGLAFALAMTLLLPSLASALTRLPTGRGLVKQTRQLLLQKLNTNRGLCVPPYTEKNITFRSKQLKTTDGSHTRLVTYTALHSASMFGGAKGTARIKATIAPACGIDVKMTNFTKSSYWPARPAARTGHAAPANP